MDFLGEAATETSMCLKKERSQVTVKAVSATGTGRASPAERERGRVAASGVREERERRERGHEELVGEFGGWLRGLYNVSWFV